MRLTPLFEIRATLIRNDLIGNFGRGTRAVAVVGDGSFEGASLRGTVLTPGADWVVVGDQGHAQIDVRLILQTDDDAMIYMTYTGVLEQNDAFQQAAAGAEASDFGDFYFVTQIRFETGDDRYSWLNHRAAVGEGRLLPGGVEYRVFICEPG
ncbi:MAG: DUF3237 domain-containing protein [Pseudomonadota bacterium]